MNEKDKINQRLIEKFRPLQQLLDCLPDQIYVKDTRGRFLFCNKAAVKITPFKTAAELIGRTDFDFCRPEDARRFRKEELRIIRSGVPLINNEQVYVNPAGQTFWSLISKMPLRDDSGKIIAILGSNRNITGHKKTEQALRESEARYKMIFESAREGIIVADAKTKRFKYANPAICSMFGYTADKFTKLSVKDIHPRKALPEVKSDFADKIRGQRAVTHNMPCLRRDGSLFYADINATCVTIDNKLCLVGFFTDVTQHKKNDEALKESEQRFRLLVEQLPAVTYTAALDKAISVLYVSPQVRRILGVPPDGFKADPDLWRKMLHPEDRDRVFAGLSASLKTGKPLTSEYRMITKNRRIVWVRDDARIVKDARGKPLYFQGVLYDITERKNTEESLRQAEEKFRGLVERSFDMIYTTDAKGVITYVSPASLRIFDCQPEEMIGKHFARFLMASEIPKAKKKFFEKLRGARHGSLNLEAKRKDGSSVFIELISSLITQNGVVSGTQGIIRDVTERKKAQEELQKAQKELESRVQQRTADLAAAVEKLQKEIAERKLAEETLRKTEQRFKTIFENTVVGFYRTTSDGRILLANPALVKMLGYDSFEQLSRLNLEKEGIDISTPRSAFKKRVEEQGRVVGLESVWIKRDGSKLFVAESAHVVRDDKGNVIYYEGTVQDVTKRKEAEEKLLGYQEQLRSLASQLSLAEERLRRRIATELHDHIAQNLAISKIKLSVLADTASTEDRAKQMREINDLIAQAIEDTRSLTFEVSPPVLYELGFEAAIGWLARQTVRRFGLKVDFIDDGLPKPLDNDIKVMLFQAVRELLVNIVKHAKTTKAIISTKKIRNNIRIIVEDKGAGFDASGTGARDYTKGGFGLFNIRERLSFIGGKVEIRSRPSRGTKVILFAPLLKNKSENNIQKRS